MPFGIKGRAVKMAGNNKKKATSTAPKAVDGLQPTWRHCARSEPQDHNGNPRAYLNSLLRVCSDVHCGNYSRSIITATVSDMSRLCTTATSF